MIKMESIGQPCRKCGHPVVKQVTKRNGLHRAFWYAWYLLCPGCKAMYMVDEAKVQNPTVKAMEQYKPSVKQDGDLLMYFVALDKIARCDKWTTADQMRDIAKKAVGREPAGNHRKG